MAAIDSATILEQLEAATRDSLTARDTRGVADCLRQWQTAVTRFTCDQDEERVAAIRKAVFELAGASGWSDVECADPSLTGRFGALVQLCDDGLQVLAVQHRMQQARMPLALVERFENAGSSVLQVAALSQVEREALPLLAEAGLVDWTGSQDKLVGLTAKGRQLLTQRGSSDRPSGKMSGRWQGKRRVTNLGHSKKRRVIKKDLRAFTNGGGI
ncbi:MAG TPA: hypothetical protein VER03_10645 [Bryobacteraceae bacterium]|nr:hypothetical protein [Bryobacteraceae bacterium]